MYELANRYEGFVQIHSMGGIFGGYDEVSVMAERYPKALTILSHCLPATPPHLIGKLLDKHPNVAANSLPRAWFICLRLLGAGSLIEMDCDPSGPM